MSTSTMNTGSYREAIAAFNTELDGLAVLAENASVPKAVTEQIEELKQNASSEDFKVLVIGEFSSGKSTMVNALLGEPLLPERATTATAIITEIRYGEEKRAVLYPKEDEFGNCGEPFEVPIEDIRDYLLIGKNINLDIDRRPETIANDNSSVSGEVIISPYKKMEIFWPLDILKDGVQIVDSPGLNDPSCYGLVANEYLSKVHAIIYLMNGLKAGAKTDFDEIEELRKRCFTTPIFVITRYDNIVDDAEEQYDPEAAIREYRDSITSILKSHTDLYSQEYRDKLGGNGIFFVSSKQAKQAKKAIPMNEELYVRSGYSEFERYLSDYLVKCKGEDRMKSLQTRFNSIAEDCVKMMSEQLRAADTPLDEFNKKIADVQTKLRLVNEQSKLFVKEFNIELDKIVQDDVLPLVPEFLDEAVSRCDSWANSYKSTVKYKFTQQKACQQAIATECQAHFEKCFKDYQVEWTKDTLAPTIQQAITRAGKKLEERSKKIDNTLNEIKLTLNFTSSVDGVTASTTAKVTSVVYGLVTGDVVGALGGYTTGLSGFGQTLLVNAIVQGALVLITGVVSLPVLAVGAIISAIFNVGTMGDKVKSKIAKKMAEDYKRELKSQNTEENVRNQLKKALDKQFVQLKKAAKDAAFSDVQLIETEIKQLADEKKKGEQAVKEHKERLNANISQVEILINNVESIHKTIA